LKLKGKDMNKRMSFASLFTCLVSAALFGCGSAGGAEPASDSVSQALSPVSIYMYVQPGTLTPVPPTARLYEDPNRATLVLTLVTVLDNATSDHGSYSTSADQAIVAITATEWTAMTALIADNSQQVRVDMTYDSSATGTTKPLIAGPTFTAVPLAP
jgi:hypothetical protein